MTCPSAASPQPPLPVSDPHHRNAARTELCYQRRASLRLVGLQSICFLNHIYSASPQVCLKLQFLTAKEGCHGRTSTPAALGAARNSELQPSSTMIHLLPQNCLITWQAPRIKSNPALCFDICEYREKKKKSQQLAFLNSKCLLLKRCLFPQLFRCSGGPFSTLEIK